MIRFRLLINPTQVDVKSAEASAATIRGLVEREFEVVLDREENPIESDEAAETALNLDGKILRIIVSSDDCTEIMPSDMADIVKRLAAQCRSVLEDRLLGTKVADIHLICDHLTKSEIL